MCYNKGTKDKNEQKLLVLNKEGQTNAQLEAIYQSRETDGKVRITGMQAKEETHPQKHIGRYDDMIRLTGLKLD